jgi:septum formation protein
MLRALSGHRHEVVTGVCVRRGAREKSVVVSTAVRLVPLTEDQIEWYVATGEPLDKAGAYAVQGIGGAYVAEVGGSISNVVGLPLAESIALLEAVGFRFPWSAPEGR